MERREEMVEEGREEEGQGREGNGRRGTGKRRAVEGNCDTVLAVSHAITRTINSLRIILYEDISSEV